MLVLWVGVNTQLKLPVHGNDADRPVSLYAVVVPSMELISTSSSQYQRQLGYVMTSIDLLLSLIRLVVERGI
jgi:hypothetical protein